MTFEETLAFYDKLVTANPNFERKGKTVPYTSANGHMFSIVNKDGELGFRYGKADQEQFMKDHETTFFMSHGARMRGYVLIPEAMFSEEELLGKYLQKSYEYVMSLDPK